jgi:DNA-binding NarL/FixJ family response regulator
MPTQILIADDNALVRNALRHVLESTADWHVIEAENGEEAIARAEESKPDLIILDLAMPQMDGLRTARALLKIMPEVPILIHTLYWSPRVQVEATKIGVRKVVAKSESGVLIAAVRELLPENYSAAPPTPESQAPSTPPQNAAHSMFPSTIVVIEASGGKSDKKVSDPPADGDPKNQRAN